MHPPAAAHRFPPATRRAQAGRAWPWVVAGLAALGGLLAAVPGEADRPELARQAAARSDLRSIANALHAYALDNGTYPSTRQGLAALVRPPAGAPVPRRWQAALRELPLDPWSHPYRYVFPSPAGGFGLQSLGADGAPGGDQQAADLFLFDPPLPPPGPTSPP